MNSDLETRLRRYGTEFESTVRATAAARRRPLRTVPAASHRRVAWAMTITALLTAAVIAVVALQGSDNRPRVTSIAARPIEATPEELPAVGADLEIFMRLDASDSQIARVRTRVESIPGIDRFAYVDHDAAVEEFQRVFADDPDLVRNITPDALPVSFRLVLKPGQSKDEIREAFEEFPGVDVVEDHLHETLDENK